MINKSGITDTVFSDDQTSVDVTHADGTKATYTGEDLYAICEAMFDGSHRTIVSKDEQGNFHTEISPV
jgi:hypothetical protein